ncbi:hypothetical protein ACC790_38160, partial [Rhizobium johnstonii]
MEWLRSVILTGFPWNAIGYGIMPVPLMMQSAHVIGAMGVTALAVFFFSAPSLAGTRQGARTGIGAITEMGGKEEGGERDAR